MRALIGDDLVCCSMAFPHIVQKELGKSVGVQGGDGGRDVLHLFSLISEGNDRVKSLTWRKSGDQVSCNDAPKPWYRINGFECTVWLLVSVLHRLTGMTILDSIMNVLLKSWPIIIVGDCG